MPNCIQYRRKGSTEAVALNALDDEICAHLKVKPDPDKFHLGWFDYIGFQHAMGLENDKIRERIAELATDPEDHYRKTYGKILDYLEEHFTTNAFVEIGRR
jgi:hypothetical protein